MGKPVKSRVADDEPAILYVFQPMPHLVAEGGKRREIVDARKIRVMPNPFCAKSGEQLASTETGDGRSLESAENRRDSGADRDGGCETTRAQDGNQDVANDRKLVHMMVAVYKIGRAADGVFEQIELTAKTLLNRRAINCARIGGKNRQRKG